MFTNHILALCAGEGEDPLCARRDWWRVRVTACPPHSNLERPSMPSGLWCGNPKAIPITLWITDSRLLIGKPGGSPRLVGTCCMLLAVLRSNRFGLMCGDSVVCFSPLFRGWGVQVLVSLLGSPVCFSVFLGRCPDVRPVDPASPVVPVPPRRLLLSLRLSRLRRHCPRVSRGCFGTLP